MSQQHINDQEINRDDVRSYNSGYGECPRQGSLSSTYGEKVPIGVKIEGYSVAFRWSLAVISLILWIVMFWILIGKLTTLAAGHFYAGDNVGNIQTFLICGLIGFTALVIVINILFNRKR